MADKYLGGIKAGSTSVSINVQLRNLTDNLGTTGKVAANFTLAYQRQGAASATQAASDLALITTAFTAGGVKEVDATNFPGLYRVDFPDAAFAAGVDYVMLGVVCAATYNWSLMIPLSTMVVQSGDNFARIGAAGAGLTALGDARIVNLDAAVSSRSTYAGADTAGTTTLLTRLAQALLFSAAGNVKADVEEWRAAVPNALSSGKVDAALIIRGGTAQAGAAGSITLDAGASAVDNFYRGAKVLLVSATGVGQCRLITGYTGATKVATIAPNWITNPDATSVFIIGAWAAVDVEQVGLTAQTARDLGLQLDATVSSRSTFAGGAVASVTGAVGSVAGLTAANLDVAVSSRSTYSGTDTPGTTTLLANVAALPQAPLGFKKNTLFPAFTFPMFNPTDHLTPKTGLVVTATRLIDGAAAFGACANPVTEVGATGFYRFDIAAADVNGNDITFSFTAPGGDPLSFSIKTVP